MVTNVLLTISLINLICSPQIQAASAKLTELKSKSPNNNNSGSGTNTPTLSSPFDQLPSGNEEVLTVQRKRFEDLKVCLCLFVCLCLYLICVFVRNVLQTKILKLIPFLLLKKMNSLSWLPIVLLLNYNTKLLIMY